MVSYQLNPSGQQFLHHALLEGAGLVAADGEFGVHARENGSDGGLLGDWRDRQYQFHNIGFTDAGYFRAYGIEHELLTYMAVAAGPLYRVAA